MTRPFLSISHTHTHPPYMTRIMSCQRQRCEVTGRLAIILTPNELRHVKTQERPATGGVYNRVRVFG